MISSAERAAFLSDGVVVLRGPFRNWVDLLRAGVDRNLHSPGPYFADNVARPGAGRFWDDYCNWRRIPEFETFILESESARLAAEMMGSETAQFFHDHVLVKEPGTDMPTPWHQDGPYYFVDGTQTVSFWLPLDPVPVQRSLRFVAGSHRWKRSVRPVKWKDDSRFYETDDDIYMDMPDLDANPREYSILAWAMEPGDAVLFDFRAVHGADGNAGSARRRAFSMRWVGDDARYVQRSGRTSPPFPDHAMRAGQRLREDWFPVLWPKPRG